MFTRELGLTGTCDYRSVVDAVRAEERRAAKSVRLRATRVVDHGDGVFEVMVSGFPNLDWAWEGAKAFRPADMDDQLGEETQVWGGEVVGIEADEGSLFVATAIDSQSRPCIGSFFVKPFDYLAALLEILTEEVFKPARADLEAILANTKDLSPGNPRKQPECSDFDTSFLSSSWSLLWGPPGTGKTHTIGHIVRGFAELGERVLVVSTTNQATDGVAIQIGRRLGDSGIDSSVAVRLGSGSNYEEFEKAGLEKMISGTERDLRREIAALRRRLKTEENAVERARLQLQLQETQKALTEAGEVFGNTKKSVVVCTAYGAIARLLKTQTASAVAAGQSPFTAIVMDEAGLLSRAMTSALALLAAHRVVLVGDPRQLAPISRMSRILPVNEAVWLGSSGLSSLGGDVGSWPNATLLARQYRMNPQIRYVVSEFQYQGKLQDAQSVNDRPDRRDPSMRGLPRALWYALDDDAGDQRVSIRAVRGPGNRSWIRERTERIVDRILKDHPQMRDSKGLFITPFAAQARRIKKHLARSGFSSWSASTVHAQQGAEADFVIFDTVHSGSTGWPYEEWQRLINVAISRAREQLIVFASRSEMEQPYLRPLTEFLTPVVYRRGKWQSVARQVSHTESLRRRRDASSLGAQLERRKALRPVLSAEQERLCGYKMDGKPRLVRGVAGSGKTYVLANWLSRTVGATGFSGKAWVVYANQSLKGLLEEMVSEAWKDLRPGETFPYQHVEFLHIKELLEGLASQTGLRIAHNDRFEYEAISERYLDRVSREQIQPRCGALFIDEAQDLGNKTLELVFALVESPHEEPDSKPAMVFYDNAQNVYGRSTPTWSSLGLNMIGRATVMKESFRSTWPINEFALNVLLSLEDPTGDADYKELIDRGLIEEQARMDRPWWKVHFNRVDGPPPQFRRFPDREREIAAAVERVRSWIIDEGISPQDIKVLSNGKIRSRVVEAMQDGLRQHGVNVVHEARQNFSTQDDALIVSTAHSFKGYEAEAVVVPCADRFVGGNQLLASALYVAMTRARSLLYVSSINRAGNGPERQIVDSLIATDRVMRGDTPAEEIMLSGSDTIEEIGESIGAEHSQWLSEISKGTKLNQEPLLNQDGSILAEPAFWITSPDDEIWACFPDDLDSATKYDLKDAGVRVLKAGTPLS
jgi:superfamily I DNA/RNA helicase